MATLKEIAAELGISHTVVSSVLNNRMGTIRVSEALRKKIIKRAKALDYHPNPSAIALRRGHKGVVGVFIHRVGVPGSELSLQFVHAVSEAVSNRRFNLYLRFFDSDRAFFDICTEQLLNRMDGLILAGLPHTDLTANLKTKGLRLVTASHGGKQDPDVANFQVNGEAQCYLPTRHLLERGCKRVAHFYTSPYRYAGFLKAHADMTSRIHDDLIVPTPFYYVENGKEGMKRLLATGKPPDGLVAQSDAQALGAIHALIEAKIPMEQWPLISGVDDSPIASDLSLLPLTSTTTEAAACGKMAVEAIFNLMDGQKVSSALLEPKLAVRASSERPVPALE